MGRLRLCPLLNVESITDAHEEDENLNLIDALRRWRGVATIDDIIKYQVAQRPARR